MDGSVWKRYVALGESTTSEFCHELTTILDGHARLHGGRLEFTNLASGDGRIRAIVDEQVPAGILTNADLVSVTVGVLDLIQPRADPDALAAQLDSGVRLLRTAGAHVLLAGCFDPQFGFSPAPVRSTAAAFNANVWSIARSTGSTVLDLWSMREFQSPAMWTPNRTHVSDRGNRMLATRAAHALHVPYAEVAAHAVGRTNAPWQRTDHVGGHQ